MVRGEKRRGGGVHLYILKCNYVLYASEDDDTIMLALIERSLEHQHQNLVEIDEWMVAVGVVAVGVGNGFVGSGRDEIENK